MKRLFNKLPLIIKMILVIAVVGMLVWLVSDHYRKISFERSFKSYLMHNLDNTALEYRLRFSRYVHSHTNALRIFSTQVGLINFIENVGWVDGKRTLVKFHAEPPQWFPDTAVLRAFANPRYAFLMDTSGVVKEVYNSWSEPPPSVLLNPTSRLLKLSQNESYLTSIDGSPVIITSGNVYNIKGKKIAMLMLASPFDEEFIIASMGFSTREFIVALMSLQPRKIMVSSNSYLLPSGTLVEDIKDDYLILEQEFFEYGSSEMVFKFISLMPKVKLDLLLKPLLFKVRMQSVAQAFLFIGAFAIVMLLITRRVLGTTKRIELFSHESLGIEKVEGIEGDELDMLELRFHELTEDVLTTHETLKDEAEKRIILTDEVAKIRQSEKQLALLQAITETLGIGVAIVTSDDELKPINTPMQKYFDAYGESDCFNIRQDTEREIDFEFKDGSIHTFHVMAPKLELKGKVILAADITERKNAIKAITQSRNDWESTFNSITDIITIHDKDFNIVAANDAAREHLDLPMFKAGKSKCFNHYHGTDAPPKSCASCDCLVTGLPVTTELFEQHLDKFIELRAIPRLDSAGRVNGLIHIVRDITDRKRLEDELKRHALYDSLTGLPNRVLFMDRLENLFEHISRQPHLQFAILFIDIDLFKKVNDSLGHSIGDELLIEIAQRFKNCVRSGDTVSRFGGDEFLILVDDIKSKVDLENTIVRIQESMSNIFVLKGNEISVSASIGIAKSSARYEKAEDMLRDADIAMYHAKVNGRGGYTIFDENMHKLIVETIKLENDLRGAIDNNELTLLYQPIVDTLEGKILGFEALARWEHPELGLIMPDRFIRLAEDTGMIVDLGKWVIKEAARQSKIWQSLQRDEPLYISINLSIKQFKNDLPDFIANVLIDNDLYPECLRVEITETVLMEDPEAATELMTRLRNMSIQIYLDDFGTGYSSLNYIHKFPIDVIKIDRTFVKNIDTDTEVQEIIKTIVSLAENLNMNIIIEGVENVEQLNVLNKLNCYQIQGHFFSVPLSVDDAVKFMQTFNIKKFISISG